MSATYLFAILFLACAFAHERPRVFEECKQDLESLCASVTDHHEIRRCMHDNWDQLSEGCQNAIKQFKKEKQEQFQAACGSDVETFCTAAKGNFDQMKECMHTNWESLSAECREVLSHHRREHHGEHHGEHEDHRDGHRGDQDEDHDEKDSTEEEETRCPMAKCVNDVHTLCPEATTKEAARDCLKTNWDALSQECRTAIEEMIKANNAHTTEEENTVVSMEEVRKALGSEGMANRELEDSTRDHPLLVHGAGRDSVPTPWYYWFTRLWWTYPIGLVLIIQLLGCIRIRQIRKLEAEL